MHGGLAGAVDYAAYRTETFRYASLQVGETAPGELAFDFPPGPPDHGRRIAAYVGDASKRERGAGKGLHAVELEDEDEAVVDSVERGARSRFYRRGRYSPAREVGVHHFHHLLAEFLAGVRAAGREPTAAPPRTGP